jgi:peptidoglycan/LPS O-acetylase OafA/YrhL
VFFFIKKRPALAHGKCPDRCPRSLWRRTGGPVSLLLLLLWKVLVPFDNEETAASGVLALVANHVLLPLSLAWLFYGLLSERSWSSRLLASNLFQLLGSSSCSFYLIHIGVLQLALYNYVSSNIFVLFMLLNLSAILLFKWVEHPLQQWLTRATRPLAGIRYESGMRG